MTGVHLLDGAGLEVHPGRAGSRPAGKVVVTRSSGHAGPVVVQGCPCGGGSVLQDLAPLTGCDGQQHSTTDKHDASQGEAEDLGAGVR